MKKIAGWVSMLSLMTSALVLIGAGVAQAHTPSISASCSGVTVSGTNYEGDKTNTWTATVGGVVHSGTFGASFSETFPVPQDGASIAWSAHVQAEDGGYAATDSGTVGPCGTPPPPHDECANLPGDQPEGTSCTQPDDKVENSSTESKDCSTFVITTHHTHTVTPYVFNDNSNTWVLGTPVVTHPADTTRPATLEECPAPTKPEPIVTHTTKTGYVCGDDFKTVTTTTTTTDWVLNEDTRVWSQGTPVVTVDVERVTTPVVACPVRHVPPPHKPLPVKVVYSSGALPNTGGIDPLYPLAAFVLLVGGGALILGERRYHRVK